MWWILWAGCPQSTDETDIPHSDVPTASTAATGDTGPAGTGHTGLVSLPPADPVAIRATAQAAIDFVPSMSITDCLEAWEAASANRTPFCPYWTERGITDTWKGTGCVDTAGVGYVGNMTFFDDLAPFTTEVIWPAWFVEHGAEVVPGWAPGQGFAGTMEGMVISATGSATVDDEDIYMLVGEYQSITAVQDGLRVRYHGLEGICTSAQATGTWVDVVRPWLHLVQMSPEGASTWRTEVWGQMAGLPSPYTTVSFDAVTLVDPALGGACTDEPTGAIELRHEDGWIYRVELGGACDGCGTLADGTEICLDFAPMRRELATTAGLESTVE